MSMGLIAMPSMLHRKYNKHVVTGAIAAGGLLGIIIPPSIPMILYSVVGRESIGSMFMGGVVPGIILTIFYCLYIYIRSQLNPTIGPPLPVESRASWGEKITSLRAVILPILIIVAVLGSIYTGFATPTEASAVGAFGACLSAVINRRFDWKTVIQPAVMSALRLCVMCFWILAGATFFNNVYIGAGARAYVIGVVTGLQLNPWLTIIIMQLSLFIFGCLMDDYAIIVLIAPLYSPIVKALGFDGLWFGVLFILNMQIACLTPPYGFNLFYMRGLTHHIRDRIPEDITMMDIYRAVFQFIPMQVIALVLCMVFPQLITWLPGMMMRQV
jgi:tripartite ATP-independent transporter DctM subunit